MKNNKFEFMGETFYILKKSPEGKASKIFFAYNMRTWNLITLGTSHEKIKELIKNRYEGVMENDYIN